MLPIEVGGKIYSGEIGAEFNTPFPLFYSLSTKGYLLPSVSMNSSH